MGTVLEIESTKAKTRFASLARQAQARDIAITRHGHVQAYVLSPERYAHLAAVDLIGTDAMQQLDQDFDALVARMQSGAHTRAADKLASASPDAVLADALATKPRKGKPSS